MKPTEIFVSFRSTSSIWARHSAIMEPSRYHHLHAEGAISTHMKIFVQNMQLYWARKHLLRSKNVKNPIEKYSFSIFLNEQWIKRKAWNLKKSESKHRHFAVENFIFTRPKNLRHISPTYEFLRQMARRPPLKRTCFLKKSSGATSEKTHRHTEILKIPKSRSNIVGKSYSVQSELIFSKLVCCFSVATITAARQRTRESLSTS